MINLFVKPPPPDIAEGHENVALTVRIAFLHVVAGVSLICMPNPNLSLVIYSLTVWYVVLVVLNQSCSLFAGTPRDLILNTDLKTLASRLKEIPDCNLYFKLFSHRRLLKAHRLIAENEALGR
jgi:hypothetical protein